MSDRRSKQAAVALGLVTMMALGTVEGTRGQPAAVSGVISRDGKRALISRTIGDERWAITRNLADDDTVTGNVFRRDGGEPQFVWCESGGAASRGQESFSCWGAEQCLASPCTESEWSFIGDVTVNERFFDGVRVAWKSVGDPVTLPRSFFEPPQQDQGTRSSGVQVTRDGLRNLVSKDVGSDRWAITLNPDDDTVTGNVFSADGGAPTFLWCEDMGGSRTEASLQCYVAGEPAGGMLGPIEDAEDRFFVDGLNGDDDALGTRALPLKTIQTGIEAARAVGGGEVYVAGGIYTETVELRSQVHVYGGFNPSASPGTPMSRSGALGVRTGIWVRDIANFTSVIQAPEEVFCCDDEDHACCDADGDNQPLGPIGVLGFEIALATFDGFEIRVPDAADREGSSIGISLTDALVVRIANNTIRAGDGADGTRGLDGALAVAGISGGRGLDAGACPPDRRGGAGGLGAGFATDGGEGGTGGAAGGFSGQAGADSAASGAMPTRGGAGGAGGVLGQAGSRGRSGVDGEDGSDGRGGSSFGSLFGEGSQNLVVYRPARGFGGRPGVAGTGGGGGGVGGGGGAFNVPAERLGEVRLATVCLEHGKSEPRAAIPYRIIPIEQFSRKPEVFELLKLFGQGRYSQAAVQAAAWHLSNDMSWETLARKRIRRANGASYPYFNPAAIRQAMQLSRMAVQRAQSQEEGDYNARPQKREQTRP